MKAIPPVRFNALAGYARAPQAVLFAGEVAWFEHGGERVLGVVLRDRIDDDYTGMVMARDRHGRFRAVDFTEASLPTQRRAEVLLRPKLEQLAMAPDEEYYQGDEKGKPLDFFTPRAARPAPRNLSPSDKVRAGRRCGPARATKRRAACACAGLPQLWQEVTMLDAFATSGNSPTQHFTSSVAENVR